jgi:hypothetical protein
MTCKKCGNNEFKGTHIIYADAVFNKVGDFIRYENDTLEKSIHDAEHGDDVWCSKCDEEYQMRNLYSRDDEDDEDDEM